MTQTTKQAKYEARLAFAIATTIIHSDFASVKSTSDPRFLYIVKINPTLNVPYECNCPATTSWCIHMEAVSHVLDTQYSSFYERIGMKRETVEATGESIESVVDEAETMLAATPDEIALVESEMHEDAKRARYAEWKANELAPLYDEPHYCVTCGKLCKREQCGRCILGC